jgi:tetratricopeptide (TPR) repeat protein
MARRRAKTRGWEAESEAMVVTLAMKRRIWKGVLATSEKTLDEFSQLSSDDKRFYQLPAAAMAAFNLNRYSEAEELARRTLEIADRFKDDWNYGNAIHLGHTVLGLLALRSGNVQLAVTELYESGSTVGSPQLGSFGPTMRLAKELLEQGRSQDVVEFLHQCHGFWRMGERWLFIWEKKIMRGVIPNFFMNLYR